MAEAARFAILSLGCKVNQYESQALAEELARRGLAQVPFESEAEVYVVNTCTVTGMSDRKSRQMIRRTKRVNPRSILAVMGCYSQLSPESIRSIDEADIIWGTRHRELLPDAIMRKLAAGGEGSTVISDMSMGRSIDPLYISGMADRDRTYVKVEDGCNRFCSYCAIPYARGPVCSREPDDIVEEVRRLAADGCREVVLIGINLGVYGTDLPGKPTMPQVIRQVAEVPGILRIRLGSMEPDMVTDEFLETVREVPQLCSHFHMSLQSGCDRQLRDMRRLYTAEEYLSYCDELRSIRPDAAICTDLMVGFPGETDEDFEESLAFAKRVNFAAMHIFKYSRRHGTRADAMSGQISDAVKQRRSDRFLAEAAAMSAAFNARAVGKTVEVLVERAISEGDLCWEGHTDNFIDVKFSGGDSLVNTVRKVNILGSDSECAYGTIEKSSI